MRKKAIIISYSELKNIQNLLKNKKTVLVGGCFDLIHYGHLQFLRKAKETGNYLIVSLESDEFIKKNKRKEPIHTQEERAEILASLHFVDMVVCLPYFSNNKQYFDMVKTTKPKIIAVTDGDSQLENKKVQAKAINAVILVVTPLLRKFSTSKIVNEVD